MKLKTTLFTIFAALILTACGSKGDEPPRPDDNVSRTLLVYMIADCDLGYNGWAERDLAEMRYAVDHGLNGGRVLVFHNAPGAHDRLVELMPDSTMREIVDYEGDGLSALSVERMKQVIADSRREAPAAEYGLVVWGHGTGWIEETSSRSDGPQRSIGLSDGRRMKVTSFAEALTDTPFDWIYFDLCHLGVIEAVYELRHVAKTIVASTTELPLEGMPYKENLPHFFKPTADLVAAAGSTYDYYMNSPEATTRSCSIAVYDTEALDAFADATAAIMAAAPKLPYNYKPIQYGRGSRSGTIFDMREYIMATDAPQELKTAWDAAYDDLIVYTAATPTSYGFDMSKFTGLGSHIVETMDDVKLGYGNFQWWTDVVSKNPDLR